VRITFLYQYFGTPAGSWSTRVYELVKRWVDAGHSVTVITSPYPKSDIKTDKFVDRQFIDGINIIVINSGDNNLLPYWKRMLRATMFSCVSSYFHIITKSDITIASSGPITIGIPALLGKWFFKKKYVFEVRDLWPAGAIELGIIDKKVFKKIALFFEKLCYGNSSLIVPCSMDMESNILQRFPSLKTLVIPNASDTQLFQKSFQVDFPLWLDSGKKLFIYAGSLGYMDSCMEIVYAAKIARNISEFQIIIIGKGSEENDIKQEISRLGLNSIIKVVPLIPKFQLVEWYKKATASFVLFKNFSTLSSSSPNKMFDSFAAGVPIIQNTKGWIKDLVVSKQCGINALPNNPRSMAEAIDFMIENPYIVQAMKSNSLKLALHEFSRDALSQKYLDSLVKISNGLSN